MGYNFSGENKIISLTSGTTLLDVRDLYSRWKDWVVNTGSMYLQAFEVIGGEPIDLANGIYTTSYFFLTNGWKIKPQESNHKLNVVNGILLTNTGDDPFISTIGNYNVLILYSQPIKSETISTGGGSGGLSVEEKLQLSEIYKLHGLDPNKPLVVSDTLRKVEPEIIQTFTSNLGTTTVTRIP